MKTQSYAAFGNADWELTDRDVYKRQALGDMPFVTEAHLRALLAADGDMAASALDGQAMPPALFSRTRAQALLGLEGDRGAGRLLADATLVPGDAALLADIDRPSDL